MAEITSEGGEPKRALSPGLAEILLSYAWPGNVRELHNVLEHAVAMSRDALLLPEHLPAYLLRAVSVDDKEGIPGSLASVKAEAERAAIVAALKAANGNKSRAASLLCIHRVKLYEKMKRHGIPSSTG